MKRIASVLLLLFVAGCANTTPKPEPEFVAVRPIVALPPPVDNGGLYQANYGISLFSDVSAKRVGDIITVILDENTNASKKTSTNVGKESTADLLSPTIGGGLFKFNGKDILNASIDQKRKFKGTGDSSQSNSLNGRVSVTVSDVLANGYLVVQGEKRLTLNQGSEFVRFSGIVRPSDIKSDNTILSTSVANAQIIYGGTGALADASAPGWMTRVFNSPWWPF